MSMGGHIVIKMLENWDIQNLFLFCPAIYSTNAYCIEFGNGFTDLIREKESWRNSDVRDILSKFSGNLMIVTASKDQVIPHEVISMIYDAATATRSKQIITIEGSGHALLTYLANNPDKADDVIEQMINTIMH